MPEKDNVKYYVRKRFNIKYINENCLIVTYLLFLPLNFLFEENLILFHSFSVEFSLWIIPVYNLRYTATQKCQKYRKT